jgi:hypothetical protein
LLAALAKREVLAERNLGATGAAESLVQGHAGRARVRIPQSDLDSCRCTGEHDAPGTAVAPSHSTYINSAQFEQGFVGSPSDEARRELPADHGCVVGGSALAQPDGAVIEMDADDRAADSRKPTRRHQVRRLERHVHRPCFDPPDPADRTRPLAQGEVAAGLVPPEGDVDGVVVVWGTVVVTVSVLIEVTVVVRTGCVVVGARTVFETVTVVSVTVRFSSCLLASRTITTIARITAMPVANASQRPVVSRCSGPSWLGGRPVPPCHPGPCSVPG